MGEKFCIRHRVDWQRKFSSAAEGKEGGETCLPVVDQTCEKTAKLFARAYKRPRGFPWGP